jgi:hypothetical protein
MRVFKSSSWCNSPQFYQFWLHRPKINQDKFHSHSNRIQWQCSSYVLLLRITKLSLAVSIMGLILTNAVEGRIVISFILRSLRAWIFLEKYFIKLENSPNSCLEQSLRIRTPWPPWGSRWGCKDLVVCRILGAYLNNSIRRMRQKHL